ncbi:FecR domain-containing protein [Flavitalea sp. BT771]|uniref:FecR family protein n=1 Tax=Flavitalea sp. BT771 TaxID=3063329 RepID=UPI0026E29D2F|nr:FecR domain-containing protein [Flavitalea sp. BT771]MDO6431166.1 FecR domain-containing protein [Flavitalea sp. BT771]MDV6220073.1 FecR domain-containing protein [Flavitalea sp. BT771]
MPENYRDPEDLLSDPSFLSWYFKTGEENDRTWEDWMTGRPDRDLLVKKAISLLEATRLPEIEPSPQQLQKAESALMQRIEVLSGDEAQSSSAVEVRKPSIVGRYRWMTAAAVLVLLAAGFLITKYRGYSHPEIRTPYGQINRQQLPDGTEVTMNANSRLSYSPGWHDGADREVWVDGEVFFHVRKTPLKSKFIVHTEHFDIIVTGTQFNVSNRHGADNVLLQEGSVTIRTKDGKTLVMKPGDFVAFDPAVLEKKTGCKEMLLAWKEQKLILDHTSISQLATIIRDLYGTPVVLEGDSIADRKISGILPNNNLDILLQALEATAEYDVARGDHGIIIRAHAQKN